MISVGSAKQAVVLRDPQHDGGQEGQEHDVAPMAVGRLQEVVTLAVQFFCADGMGFSSAVALIP